MKWCVVAIIGLLLVASTSFVDGKTKVNKYKLQLKILQLNFQSYLQRPFDDGKPKTTTTNKFEGDFEFVDEVSCWKLNFIFSLSISMA